MPPFPNPWKTDNKSRKMKGGFVDPSKLPKTKDNLTACRWCSGNVYFPRKTFCSKECAHEHMLRTNPSYMRKMCYERDKGICADCKIDTKKTAKEIREKERIANPYKRKKTKYILQVNEESKKVREKYNITEKRKVHQKKLGVKKTDVFF